MEDALWVGDGEVGAAEPLERRVERLALRVDGDPTGRVCSHPALTLTHGRLLRRAQPCKLGPAVDVPRDRRCEQRLGQRILVKHEDALRREGECKCREEGDEPVRQPRPGGKVEEVGLTRRGGALRLYPGDILVEERVAVPCRSLAVPCRRATWSWDRKLLSEMGG